MTAARKTSASPVAQRRILLCAIGMSPQIVTETLYALAVQPSPGSAAWVPTEVHVITTAQGAHNARLTLLSGQPGWFHQLRRDYQLPPVAFDDEHIHVIAGTQGELDDIRSPADNHAAADAIAQIVRDLTQDPDAELHASLAGGRKTMSYYLGYAMSLFGRQQDRLSHVLVSPEYEAHPEFFYPTPYERVIHSHAQGVQKVLDCAEARVELAEIPFLRLRGLLPKGMLHSDGRKGAGEPSFSDIVRRTEQSLQPPTVALDAKNCFVWVNGIAANIRPAQFGLYAWLAHRQRTGAGAFNPRDVEQVRAYLHFVRVRFGQASRLAEQAEEGLLDPDQKQVRSDPDALMQTLSPRVSRVRSYMSAALGPLLTERCCIQSAGNKDDLRYFLSDTLTWADEVPTTPAPDKRRSARRKAA